MLTFPAKAGETGKLYGSITAQMIVEAIQAKIGLQLDRRQLDAQPIRILGEHKVHVRLTMDLVPEVMVIVHREGEAPALAQAEESQPEDAAEPMAEAEAASEE